MLPRDGAARRPPPGAASARRRSSPRPARCSTRTASREAQIDDIADAVGINRAIVYRHFSGKEELFALTLVGYLDELQRRDGRGRRLATRTRRPGSSRLVGAFVDYGVAHPAFIDCAQALMRRRGDDLLDEISETALFRLGRGISGCLAVLQAALQAGVDAGEFRVEDPTLLANTLYASGLGALQLARVGILVTESAPGIPTVGEVSPDQVRAYLVDSALALATR